MTHYIGAQYCLRSSQQIFYGTEYVYRVLPLLTPKMLVALVATMLTLEIWWTTLRSARKSNASAAVEKGIKK